MEPSRKKGVFVGYNESSKAYRIYVLGQRQIEVSRDVTFHEEATLKISKEIPYDIDTKDRDTPMSKVPQVDSTHPDVQRENPVELSVSLSLYELV